MKLLSCYENEHEHSNKFRFRMFTVKDPERFAVEIEKFHPQVIVAELESENSKVIELSENGWYGFGLYLPSDKILEKMEKLKFLPKIIYLTQSNYLKKDWLLFGHVVLKHNEYDSECNLLVFSSLL